MHLKMVFTVKIYIKTCKRDMLWQPHLSERAKTGSTNTVDYPTKWNHRPYCKDVQCDKSEAVLVTPRRAVRMKWNSMMALSKTQSLGLKLITCPAFVTIQGWQLNMQGRYATHLSDSEGHGDPIDRLPDSEVKPPGTGTANGK